MENGNPHALLVPMHIGAATMENSMELSQKVKNETALWPIISTSENIHKQTWNTNLKEYVHPYVPCNIIYDHQDLEVAQMPVSR